MADGYKNPYLGPNPYLEDNINKAQGDVVRNYNMTTQPAYNSAMVKSGSFGNEGVQQMNENSQRNLQNSLGDISTTMRGQDFQNQQGMYQWDQQFGRSLFNDAYSQNMNNLTTGVGLLGTLAGYNANDLTNANTIQNTPLNYWNNFSNSANSLGQGYGTTTGTVGSTSNPLMGALGGAQLGSSLYNQYRAGSGWQPNTSAPQSNWSSYDGSGNYGTGGDGAFV